ncbi:EAL domain-containing protein [Salinispirillum sp. LH 10-3-1]|uniref:EAL domain-containing protein n=1 Tax=Salinispirillum sp. LH 10-3-1 TaxID=2952525 RepID=A0AB38YHT0_9GAMM
MTMAGLSARPRLLLVEDEPMLSKLLVTSLHHYGFDIKACSTGEEALVEFGKNAVDLILLDVHLPQMSGFDVCEAVRAERKNPSTPVIMLTGADDTVSIQRAFNAGATDFLTKPVNLPLLNQRLRYALRNRQNEEEMKRALYFQERASKLAKLGYWSFDYANDRFELNEEARLLLSLGTAEFTNETLLSSVHPEDLPRLLMMLAEQREAELEVRVILAKSSERIIHITATMYESEAVVMHGTFQDISDQRSTEDMLEFLRLHDDVTGLPNKKMLQQHLKSYLGAEEHGANVAVLGNIRLLRIGRWGEVYGQETVDALLKRISNDFVLKLRKLDFDAELYYLSEGSFCLVSRSASVSETEKLLQELTKLASLEWKLDGESHTPSVACGAIDLTSAQQNLDVQLEGLAAAIARAEMNPNNTVTWYRPLSRNDTHRELCLEQKVKEALQNRQFDLYLQPQVRTNSAESIWGFEALLRWVNSNGQVCAYSPDEFLPVVERLGLAVTLGYQVIDKAFEKAVLLKSAGLNVRLGVNLGSAQFDDPQLVPYIMSRLKESGLQASAIEFEITESTAMSDPQLTLNKLSQLREEGFHIAVDDFGVGYSSMEYLLRFPLTTLKIDRAFVRNIATDSSARAIVKAIQTLASGLGLTTVAEGVETEQQREWLKELGIDVIQGFHYSPGLPCSDAIELVKTWNDTAEVADCG